MSSTATVQITDDEKAEIQLLVERHGASGLMNVLCDHYSSMSGKAAEGRDRKAAFTNIRFAQLFDKASTQAAAIEKAALPKPKKGATAPTHEAPAQA